jgi:cellulose synthase/poly-beta-1,6-N-acetylglucosamine synthase-like glycosyltransferase
VPLNKPRLYGVNLLENFQMHKATFDRSMDLNDLYYHYRFASDYNMRKTLFRMRDMGANTVVLCQYAWQDNVHSTQILVDKTVRQDLIDAIRLAKDQGFRVVLRPMLELKHFKYGEWRGVLKPQDAAGKDAWDQWFASYQAFIDYYFEIAVAAEADIFVSGTELMAATSQTERWNQLLASLHRQNRAADADIAITYDASIHLEVPHILGKVGQGDPAYVEFFRQISHLGFSLYGNFAEADDNHPTVEKVAARMATYLDAVGRDLALANKALRAAHPAAGPKQIVISEFGIKSTVLGLNESWRHPEKKERISYRHQQVGFEALFRIMPNYEWLGGLLVWNMHIDPYFGIPNFTGRKNARNGGKDYTITGKPVEKIIREKFRSATGQKLLGHVEQGALLLYFLAAVILIFFGLHRFAYVIKRLRRHSTTAVASAEMKEWPRVTVQLPCYNEPYVMERLLQAVLAMDYDDDKLEIQILDDSTDDTTRIIDEFLKAHPRRHVAVHVRRPNRVGYKAGALSYGLVSAKGEFVAIFDADFVPGPDFLRATIPHFADPKVGMVQTRWQFINEKESLLTRIQSLFLRAHFEIEHFVRDKCGYFFNFNGTGGVFRRSVIDEAGGWRGDFLTEDLDLSYRVQLNGWKFVYLNDYGVDSELPSHWLVLKRQQFRWVKGSAQVLRAVGPDLLSAPVTMRQKTEAILHLTGNLAYVLVLLLAVVLLPTIHARLRLNWESTQWLDLVLFVTATLVLFLFYGIAKRGTSLFQSIALTFASMAVGIGYAVNNTVAYLEGLLGLYSGFERTPKAGAKKNVLPGLLSATWTRKRSEFSREMVVAAIEFMFAVYMIVTVKEAIYFGMWTSLPFTLLFVIGFAIAFLRSLHSLTHQRTA